MHSSLRCTASEAGCQCVLNLGWALQVYSQLGDESPDVDVSSLRAMYETTQRLIAEDRISAGHDISDGGIAVTLLEAAFAGNCGIQVSRLCASSAAHQLKPIARYGQDVGHQ